MENLDMIPKDLARQVKESVDKLHNEVVYWKEAYRIVREMYGSLLEDYQNMIHKVEDEKASVGYRDGHEVQQDLDGRNG